MFVIETKGEKRQRESIADYVEQEVRREIMFFFKKKRGPTHSTNYETLFVCFMLVLYNKSIRIEYICANR